MDWLTAALVAFGNFANTRIIPGAPQGTVIVVAWCLAGLFACWRVTQARFDSRRDELATLVALQRGTGTASEVAVAKGIGRLLRGVLIAVYLLTLLGIVAIFSQPPPPAPIEVQRSPGTLAGAPILIGVLASLTYGVNYMVQARERWRIIYRRRPQGGTPADESTPTVAVQQPGGTEPS